MLKVPRPEMLIESDFAARFASEIRSMVKLAHPHVVKILDVGEHEKLPFAVMQFCAAGSLEDRFKSGADGRRQAMTLASLRDWLGPVAESLDFIHSQGYVHRDIKPGNILFDEHRNAYVSDFGIAKVIAGSSDRKIQTRMTQAGIVLGTGPYMPPEMLTGEEYDGRADQYALAVTVYEVLSGSVPFTGKSAPQILKQQITGDMTPLHKLQPAVPEAVWGMLSRAVGAEPSQRFADCTAFANGISAVASGVGRPVTIAAAITADARRASAIGHTPAASKAPSAAPKQLATSARDTESAQMTTRTESRQPATAPAPQVAGQPRRQPKTLLIGGAIAACLLVMVLLTLGAIVASGLWWFRTRDGTIVLDNLPPEAEVIVDGDPVVVQRADGKPTEIRVAASKKHKLRINRNGFKAQDEEVSVDAGAQGNPRFPGAITCRRPVARRC